jgi:hypothetical protein
MFNHFMYSLLQFSDKILKFICLNQEEDELELAKAKRTLEKQQQKLGNQLFS